MNTICWRGVIGFSLGIALAANASASTPPKKVVLLLMHISSAAGGSVLDRIRACGITFADGTYAEQLTADNPDMSAHKGDWILDVYIDVPRLADQNPEAYRGLLARWVVTPYGAHPISGWAKWLQDKPIPIGSSEWMNC